MPAGLLQTIKNCPSTGNDIAGAVAAVGPYVTEFKVGNQVVTLHELSAPAGAYAEYALSSDHMTFHLGKNVTFEDAYNVEAIRSLQRRRIRATQPFPILMALKLAISISFSERNS